MSTIQMITKDYVIPLAEIWAMFDDESCEKYLYKLVQRYACRIMVVQGELDHSHDSICE